jgi:hypothetical protein
MSDEDDAVFPMHTNWLETPLYKAQKKNTEDKVCSVNI